jgi:alpha-glucosidase
MQWDASPHAGFSPSRATDPWLPLTPDWRTRNVATQLADPDSHLSLCRDLLALRHELPALRVGSQRLLDEVPDGVLAYLREHDGERVLVALNLTGDERHVDFAEAGTIVRSTDRRRDGRLAAGDRLVLGPDEGVVLRCEAARPGGPG